MAITQNFRLARITLVKLKLQRSKWIGISKTRHGVWAQTRKASDFKRWKDSVKTLHHLTSQINEITKYLDKGAVGASLDIAKAIAVWEGGRSSDGLFHPYQDSVGVWTIGYGHTNADGPPHVDARTQPLTGSEATVLLLHDLNVQYVPALVAALKRFRWKINQKMFDALLSFEYNLGPGYFVPGHTIGDAMARRSAWGVARAMLLYNKAGGRVLDGLTRRRKWEAQLEKGGSYRVTN